MVAWIHIPGLSEAFFESSILKEIGSLIEKVVKVDLQTDRDATGQFARFAVQINLSEPLVSKVWIANRIHRIEYESLLSIFFNCGRFGHLKEACLHVVLEKEVERVGENGTEGRTMVHNMGALKVQERVDKENFEEWMVVER